MLEGVGRENENLKGLAGEWAKMALAMTHANFLRAVPTSSFQGMPKISSRVIGLVAIVVVRRSHSMFCGMERPPAAFGGH